MLSSSPANSAAIGNALTLFRRNEHHAKISLFWRAYWLSQEPPCDTERFTVSVARRDEGRKFQRLKYLRKKGLRDLRNPGGPVDTEISSRAQNKALHLRRKEEIALRDNEAIGQITSAQANFMRVIVDRAGSEPTDTLTTELCGSVSASRQKGEVAKRPWGEDCLNFNSGEMAMNGVKAQSFYVGGTAVACKSNQSHVTAGDDESRLSSELSSHANVTELLKEEEHPVENGYLQATPGHAYKQTSHNDGCCDTANSTNGGIHVLEGVMDLKGEAETTGESLLHEQVLMQHESYLDTDSRTGMELLCVVRALLKKINQKVMVGDRVLVSGIDWVDRRGMVEQVLERKSELLDPPVANVDQMLILFSMDRPKVEAMTLTRFLVEAESTGVPFILVLNKSDLVTHREVDEWEDRLSSWGYRPCFCSVNTIAGVVLLCELLINKTTAIIGPSGTGKSSLINIIGDKAGIKPCSNLVVKHWESEEPEGTLDSLTSDQVQEGIDRQMVGEICDKTGRGKHTTCSVTLLKLPIGGYLVDTPGFNLPGLSRVTQKTLAQLFPEVRANLAESESGGCAFSDCLHVGEPGCEVGAEWERYPYYLQLLEEVTKREEIKIKTFGTKRESEVRYKVGAFGVKQVEPRLNLKKYRRLSRQHAKQLTATQLEGDEELEATLGELLHVENC